MSPLQMMAKWPLAKCPLVKCPLAKCLLAKCLLAKCPGFVLFISILVLVLTEGTIFYDYLS